MEGKKISHLKLENDYQSAQQPTLNMAESVVHGVPNANSMTRKSTSQTPSNNPNAPKELMHDDSATDGGGFGSKKPSYAARGGGQHPMRYSHAQLSMRAKPRVGVVPTALAEDHIDASELQRVPEPLARCGIAPRLKAKDCTAVGSQRVLKPPLG